MIRFHGSWQSDYDDLVRYIGGFYAPMRPDGPIPVSNDRLVDAIKNTRALTGAKEASAFKKAAHFVTSFVKEQPLLRGLPHDLFGDAFADARMANAAVALSYAIDSLYLATVTWHDKTERLIDKPLVLSKHSFVDISVAISQPNVVDAEALVSVLLEQIAYKTNGHCQYKAH